MAGNLSATASQAWAVLSRHARDEIAPLRLQELCRDNDRVSSLVAVYNTTSQVSVTTSDHPEQSENRILIADLSRQYMTLETLNHLLKLSTTRNLRKFIKLLSWGQNDPSAPILPKRVRKGNKHAHVVVRPSASAEASQKKATRFEDAEADEGGGRRRPVVEDIPSSAEPVPSMHLALRVPAGKGHEMLTADGTNALTAIHREWERLERLSDSLRRGQLRGVSGSMIRDVVVIGAGVPVQALKFVYTALLKDERAVLASRFGMVEAPSARIRRNLMGDPAGSSNGGAARRLKFLSTIDPITAADAVSDLDPASTLIISIALRGNEETGLATKTLKSWLLHALGPNRRPDHVLAKHMMLVTGNDHIASIINKPESVHMVPEHSRCEAFTTFSAATLLPLSIVFGWSIAKEFIAGAHDMDVHFVDTNPRHNLPVLLALTDIWNDTFLGPSSRIVTPFTEAFEGFPAFAASLESQTCGVGSDRSRGGRSSPNRPACSALVLDGGLDSIYDRALYQAPRVMNSELIMTMDSQIAFNASRTIGVHRMDDVQATQDARMCSMFAHADELAFGYEASASDPMMPSSPTASPKVTASLSEGNRPSSLLLCGKLDAFACGQLVALSEHRAIVKAHIWGIDPFARELGSSMRMHRTVQLKEELELLFINGADADNEDDEGRMNLSTKTLLRHYANVMRDQRA